MAREMLSPPPLARWRASSINAEAASRGDWVARIWPFSSENIGPQTIGTQQERVAANQRRDMPDINPRLPLGTQARQQDVAIGLGRRAPCIEPALTDEFLDEGMI